MSVDYGTKILIGVCVDDLVSVYDHSYLIDAPNGAVLLREDTWGQLISELNERFTGVVQLIEIPDSSGEKEYYLGYVIDTLDSEDTSDFTMKYLMTEYKVVRKELKRKLGFNIKPDIVVSSFIC